MKKAAKNDNALSVYQSLKNGGCPSPLTTKMESLIETAMGRVK